jgi:hypothetical protein
MPDTLDLDIELFSIGYVISLIKAGSILCGFSTFSAHSARRGGQKKYFNHRKITEERMPF